MDMTISYENGSDYLIARIDGEWTLDEAKVLVEAIYAEAVRRGFTHILLDMCEALPPDSEMIRFWTGEHIASIWGNSLKAAAVAKSEFVNRFAETVAINRGANIKVFTDKTAALQWLHGG